MTRRGTVELWILRSPFLEPRPSTFRPLCSMSLVAFFSSASHPTTMIHHWSMTEGLLSPLKATYVCACVHPYVRVFSLICSSKDVVRPGQVQACLRCFSGLRASLLPLPLWPHNTIVRLVLAHKSRMVGINVTVFARGFHVYGAVRR